MSEIFLYTKDARIGNETRKRLVDAGYIPVEVADMAAVRIMPAPIPTAQLDAIQRAALQTINVGNDWTKAKFAALLTAALTKDTP